MINFFSRTPTVSAWASQHLAGIAHGPRGRGRQALKKSALQLYRTDGSHQPIYWHYTHGSRAAATYHEACPCGTGSRAAQHRAIRARRLLIWLYYEAIESGKAPASCNLPPRH